MSPKPAAPLSIELALLGFLRQQPMHGYQIHQHLRAADGPGVVWRMKQAHLYALLARLEAEGYITGDLQTQETRPARRVFRLTESGEQAYRTWMQSPVAQARGMRQEFQLKLYFALQEGPELARGLLEQQQAICRQWLDLQSPSPGDEPRAVSFDTLVRRFRSGQIEAMLGWLEDSQRALSDLSGTK